MKSAGCAVAQADKKVQSQNGKADKEKHMTSRETIGDRSRTHGMANTRLYSVWCGIKDRCTNKNLPHYDRYGGRGIKVCEEWAKSFEAFRDWAVEAGYDDKLTGREQSIDRIDVNGDYCPENCRWITMAKQARNRSDTLYVEVDGEKISAREFASENQIEYTFAFRRIKKGDTAEVIIRDWKMKHDTPDSYMSIKEAAKFYCVTDQTIFHWIRDGKLTAQKFGQMTFIPKNKTAS